MTGLARDDLRFAVIGAGMAGILATIKLADAGYTNVVVFEKADRLGGTWRENTYPGLSCDVPSHLYSYSFRLNPDWSHLFSPGTEIQAYLETVAREHGFDEHVRYGEEVVECDLVDDRWHLTTASGLEDVADVVIAATGVLHHPRYPDIEGIDSFAGAMFHSARWDHDVSLDGARVGIIGTGSTAVQITGAIVDRVDHLSLFQRTAQWVLPQENPAYSAEQQQTFRHDPALIAETHANLSKLFTEGFANAVVDADSPQLHRIQELCLSNLEDNVKDPELRERLRPDYKAACKRLIVSENFYQAIQRPNAELVTNPIARIEPGGVRTRDGRLHELDVLVLATGFKVDSFMRPMNIRGRNGASLNERWRDRPTAYLSISVPDFPNLFMLNGPNGPVGNFSLIEVAEYQMGYILQLVERIADGVCRGISASAAALERYEADRVRSTEKTVWTTGCRSWYLDDRGIPAVWPWTFDHFRAEMAAPRIEDYELLD
jgi:cation diffusion facilitator CzcD-associated flavoprotein CzcO